MSNSKFILRSSALISLLLSTFIICCVVTAKADRQEGASIAGTYYAQGRNVGGTPYEGFVRITKGSEVDFHFAWFLMSGERYEGRGKLQNGRISVMWGAPEPVIYTVGSDGILHGTWANGRATEDLHP